MPNTILTPSIIAKAAAVLVKNNMVLGNLVNRQFINEFKKIGDTVQARKPVQYLSYDGLTMNTVNDTVETKIDVKIDKRKHLGLWFSIDDLTLKIEQFAERYLKPACIKLANDVDLSIAQVYSQIYNAVGTAGTTPRTFADVGAAGEMLTRNAVDARGRILVVNGEAEYAIPDGLKGLLQPTLVEGIVKEAAVGRCAKFDIFGDQNICAHVAGTPGGTPLSDGATQTGATIHVDGMTTTTGDYHAGDIITFGTVGAASAVYGVNPVSKVSTGKLQQFVVTALATADGSGDADLVLSPAVVATGAYQNVSQSIPDGAAVTLVASHVANLAFVKDAIALVTVPIEKPQSAAYAEQFEYEGISITLTKDFDIVNYKETTRLDIQWGVLAVYPNLACRVLG